jgi:hypothetical protein
MIFFAVSCKKDVDTLNKVPVVDAGASQNLTLPFDSAILSGTATDADGKVVAFLWSQVSGPVNAAIVNPGSALTSVKGFEAGTYVFQLMATDNSGATGVDTVSITVNPSPIQTLTLQPANNPEEFAITVLNGADASGVAGVSIEADAWTSNSQLWILRGLIKFDLSAIPSSAVIKSANLYLYSNPAPSTGNLVNANFGTSNSFVIQQVLENWSPSTVNWFNQPAASGSNQVVIASTTQSQLDLNVDVSALVASMVNNKTNYGFLIKLQNEVTYNSRIFVSSHNATYADKHPKLVIVYQ